MEFTVSFASIRRSGEPAKITVRPVLPKILNLCIEFFV